MWQAVFCWVIAFVFALGSSQIELQWLSWVQLGIGIYFAFAGAYVAWLSARQLD